MYSFDGAEGSLPRNRFWHKKNLKLAVLLVLVATVVGLSIALGITVSGSSAGAKGTVGGAYGSGDIVAARARLLAQKVESGMQYCKVGDTVCSYVKSTDCRAEVQNIHFNTSECCREYSLLNGMCLYSGERLADVCLENGVPVYPTVKCNSQSFLDDRIDCGGMTRGSNVWCVPMQDYGFCANLPQVLDVPGYRLELCCRAMATEDGGCVPPGISLHPICYDPEYTAKYTYKTCVAGEAGNIKQEDLASPDVELPSATNITINYCIGDEDGMCNATTSSVCGSDNNDVPAAVYTSFDECCSANYYTSDNECCGAATIYQGKCVCGRGRGAISEPFRRCGPTSAHGFCSTYVKGALVDATCANSRVGNVSFCRTSLDPDVFCNWVYDTTECATGEKIYPSLRQCCRDFALPKQVCMSQTVAKQCVDIGEAYAFNHTC